jgi:ankyrin repeat protein
MIRARARIRRMSLLMTFALLAALLVVSLLAPPPLDGNAGRRVVDANAMLAASVEARDLAGVRRAVADGADANRLDAAGWSALTRATSAGDVALCTELMSLGASPDGGAWEELPPIVCATLHGDRRTVELLIRHGADVNARTRGGGTALNVAASSGELEIAAVLIGAGADVNASDSHGWTPLMGAVSQSPDSAVLVEALLRAGAHPDQRDDEGTTAMQIAARQKDLRVVELLLRRRRQESYGRTLLGMLRLDSSMQRDHCG